jgi:uncharacterized protein (TIGR03067 family)
VGGLTAALSADPGQGAPARLVVATLDAVLKPLSGKAAAATPAALLAERVLTTMFMQTLKQVATVVLLIGVLGGSAAFTLHHALASQVAAEERQERAANPETESDRPADDRAALRGTWETSITVTRTVRGKLLPPEEQKFQWVITADKIVSTTDGRFVQEEWSFRLDPASNPKAIDLTSRRDGVFPGIYRLDGDRLTVYLGVEGKRPTAFPDKTEVCQVFRRVSAEPAQLSQRFASAPGCFWLVDPDRPSSLCATRGVTCLFEKAPDGAALFTLAYALPGRGAASVKEYRPVFLDTQGKRYEPRLDTRGSSGLWNTAVVTLGRWRMDPKVLPANQVARVGIEAVTAEATRLAAREAEEQARKAGIEVLPWPEIGKEYRVAFTTIDGRKLGPDDFKGKVVVIDYWASWCSPCLALMPELKRCYERWRKDGLEIVGVSLDQHADNVRKVCKDQGLTWPQVLVPTEEKARALWQASAGIESIPRVLVLDREGRLHADTSSQVEEVIAKLFTAAKPAPTLGKP